MAISALLLAACLLCLLAALAVNSYTVSVPGAGLPVTVCAGFTIVPRLQVGVSWQSPLSSMLSPLAMSPFAACIQVPHSWITLTPYHHYWSWMWP